MGYCISQLNCTAFLMLSICFRDMLNIMILSTPNGAAVAEAVNSNPEGLHHNVIPLSHLSDIKLIQFLIQGMSNVVMSRVTTEVRAK